MRQKNFISRFTPSRTAPGDLEAIFVQREELLEDAVARVRDGVTSKNKHHLLFIGPRGCGKTHLVTLLFHRLRAIPEIQDKMRIAWLNEDETTTSFLKLLVRIYAALCQDDPKAFSLADLEPIYESKAENPANELVDLLLKKLGDRCLVILVENLDELFHALGDEGQKDWRAFIQNHPVSSIVATAQRLFDEVTSREAPFFGFFQNDHLQQLSVKEAAMLLAKIAQLNGDVELANFLDTPKGHARVRALHHLSGGNHRIYITLSEFITRDSIEDLVRPFEEMVDELTPYYQERIRWLPPQQREIVHFLCSSGKPVPVKEIARQLFATSPTIASQLKKLRDMGYVESHDRGRESLYELAEPLMRLCVEVKENVQAKPLRLIVDFLRVWYERDDLHGFLDKFTDSSMERACLTAALEKLQAEPIHPRIQVLLDDLEALGDGDDTETSAERVQALREIAAERGTQQDWQNLLKGLVAIESLDECLETATMLIERKDSERELRAMAYIRRGAVYGRRGRIDDELADYSAVIEMSDVHPEQVAMAFVNRGIAHGQRGYSKDAIADFTAVIELNGVSSKQIAMAFVNRGIAHGQQGQIEEELADYISLIAMKDAPVKLIATALFNRGITYSGQGRIQEAIAVYTSLIEMENVPLEQIAMALVNRGFAYGRRGQIKEEMADYATVIAMKEAPPKQIAMALVNRGITLGGQGRIEEEMADYAAVIAMEGAPPEQVSDALFSRGISFGQQGRSEEEIADFTAVVAMKNAPAKEIAMSLFNRGVAYSKQGRIEEEIADYSSIIAMTNAPPQQMAMALINRGFAFGKQGRIEEEIADYSAVIAMKSAPPKQIAVALVNRGITRGQQGQSEKAVDDFTTVIAMERAPTKEVAIALFNRGFTYGELSQREREIADLTAMIAMEDAPSEGVAKAHWALARKYLAANWRQAMESIDRCFDAVKATDLKVGSWQGREIINAILHSGLNEDAWQPKAAEIVALHLKHGLLGTLGDGLVSSLGDLRGGSLNADGLSRWFKVWKTEGAGRDELIIPLRVFQTGIDYLKTSDETVLFDLAKEERSILREALGLDEKKRKKRRGTLK